MSIDSMMKPKSGPRDVRAEFLDEIEAFLKRHDMAPSTFGRLLCSRDDRFVFRLRAGSDPRASTISAIRTAMRKYKRGAK